MGWGKEQQFGEKRLQSKHRLLLRAAQSLWPDVIFNALFSDITRLSGALSATVTIE